MDGVTDDVQPVAIKDQVTPKTEGVPKDVSQEAPPAIEYPMEIQYLDPFEGPTTRVSQVKRDINVTQLRDELAKVAGLKVDDLQVSVAVADPGDQSGAIVSCSNTNQGVLYVSPDLGEDVVRTAISNHQADNHYGVDKALTEWPNLKEKILNGGDLSNDEVAKALKIFALKMG